jgi:hypothetical protein
MLPLRIFLMIHQSTGDWAVSSHRDFESVVDAWKRNNTLGNTGVIQVGFSRPDSSAFEALNQRFPGRMLLSAPARYIFERVGPCAPVEAGIVDGIPIFVALSGWGYETSAEDLGLVFFYPQSAEIREIDREDLESNSQKLWNNSAWLKEFYARYPDDSEILRSAGIIDDASYTIFESNLPMNLRITLGRFRFHALLLGKNPESPQDMASIAPPWILSWPVKKFNMAVRPRNVLIREGFEFIGEIKECSDSKLVDMEHMGKKSVVDIARSIHKAIDGTLVIQVSTEANKKFLENETKFSKFTDCVDMLLKSQDEKTAFVMRCRMGSS